MHLILKFAPLAFIALLPVVNPVGSALIFLGLVGAAPPEDYRRLALKIAINTAALLMAVDLLGAGLLTFFGISLPVVQVAGGGVLAAMGWNLLNEKDEPPAAGAEPARRAGSLDRSVFYPFTFPVTAGPGCIVVAVTLSAHATQKARLGRVFAHLGILGGISAMCVVVYFCYAYAPWLTRKISPETTHGLLRIIAFILLCIGAQIAWNGAEALIHASMAG